MKEFIKGLANKLGYEIRRLPSQPPRPVAYYNLHYSCQIPTLDTIYDRVFGRRAHGY
jgi:hypothetical protein